MRRTLVLVVVGGTSVGTVAAGVATSSLMLGSVGAVGLAASAIWLLAHGVRTFLDWYVSKTT
jgi:hypothetical protein